MTTFGPLLRHPAVLLGVLVSLIVGGVVISQSVKDDAPPIVSAPVSGDSSTETVVYSGPIEITGVKSFDPEGDDKTENEDTVLNVTDGDPDTWWSTTCYRSTTFGSKSGVGLVLQLNALTLAQLEVDMANRGWRAKIFASPDNAATASQWGTPIWEGSADDGLKISTTFTSPAQFVLIYFTEIGRSTFCSDNNPYRGSISEVRISPAP